MKIQDKVFKKGNTIINKFSNFKEIIIYKKDFEYSEGTDVFIDKDTGEVLKSNIDRARKFYKDDNGVLHPLNDSVKIEDIQQTISNSCKRSKDNFYGYALCNKWRYFITLTYSPKKVNKDNEEELKYCWELFRKKLQYISKDVKIICCPERHKSGKLHLHALIGDIDLTKKLTPAVNPKNNKPIYSKYGQRVYNISLWEYGFTTCVQLDNDYNDLQVANYLISYVTKQNNIGYNNKKYYRTHNLNFKNKEIFRLDWTEKIDIELANNVYKDTDILTIYRIYNTPQK
jgi:hypothetical protein